jgi:AcrR family transcriptional regulator
MQEIQPTDVKERILQVSRKLFIQNGYNGTSVRDIAAASGTNVAHIKYYFQSKYNLFEIIFEEAFTILIKRIFSILQSDMPFFELLERWIGAYYKTLMEYPQIPIFILNEVNQNPDGLVKLIKKRNPQQLFSIIARRLNEEMQKGTIKKTSVIDFALNILSLCAFPFIFGEFAIKVAGISADEYRKILAQHRVYVTHFIMDALKP